MPDVAAQPSPFTFEIASTALVVIDMQRDFIEKGGFGEALGNDVTRLAAIVPTTRALLELCRARGMMVRHTRRSSARLERLSAGEAAPRLADPAHRGEPVIVKPGKGVLAHATRIGSGLAQHHAPGRRRRDHRGLTSRSSSARRST